MKKIKFIILIIFSFTSISAKDFKILSLPAGGSTSVISVVLLKYIEEQTGKHITEIFDEIWGTSAGAIIASFVTLPFDKKIKAEEIIKFFEEAFSNFYHAYFIREKFSSIVGNIKLNQTTIPIKVLTASSKDPLECKWNLYGFDNYSQASLADIVSASCTVYPYLYRTPYRIILNEIEPSYFIDAGSLCCEFATTDPTAYFLEKFLKKLSKEDTLTIYFLANAFTQSIDYEEVSKVLETKNNDFSFSINYIDGSFNIKNRKQIEIVNVPAKINCSNLIDNYLKSLNYIYRAKIILMRLVFEKILGKENAIDNLMCTGAIPISILIEETHKIIKSSKNFQAMINDLKN